MQSKPTLKDWLVATMLLVALLFLLFGPLAIEKVRAHESPSGWSYDPDCCGGSDCMPIQKATLIDGKWYYTTKLGTKPVVPQTKIRVSKDHQTHACVYQNMLWCLYIPGGM